MLQQIVGSHIGLSEGYFCALSIYRLGFRRKSHTVCVRQKMSFRCWVFVAVLSTVTVLGRKPHLGDRFRGFDFGGYKAFNGSADSTKHVNHSSVGSHEHHGAHHNETGKGGLRCLWARLSLHLQNNHTCKAEDLCLLNVTVGGMPTIGRPNGGSHDKAWSCSLCDNGCPTGTSCIEDKSFCNNTSNDAICKKKGFYKFNNPNITFSKCLSVSTTTKPAVTIDISP